MNNKILSYEDLKEKLKMLEIRQRYNKALRKHCRILKNNSKTESKHQKDVSRTKREINLLLTAIHYAKEARKLYEYKRLYEEHVLRANFTAYYVGGIGTIVEED